MHENVFTFVGRKPSHRWLWLLTRLWIITTMHLSSYPISLVLSLSHEPYGWVTLSAGTSFRIISFYILLCGCVFVLEGNIYLKASSTPCLFTVSFFLAKLPPPFTLFVLLVLLLFPSIEVKGEIYLFERRLMFHTCLSCGWLLCEWAVDFHCW